MVCKPVRLDQRLWVEHPLWSLPKRIHTYSLSTCAGHRQRNVRHRVLLGWATEVPEKPLPCRMLQWRSGAIAAMAQSKEQLLWVQFHCSAHSQRSGNEFCDASNVERDIETLDWERVGMSPTLLYSSHSTSEQCFSAGLQCMLHWRQFFTGQAVPDTAGHVPPLPLHMPVVTFSLRAGQQTGLHSQTPLPETKAIVSEQKILSGTCSTT